MRSTDPQVYLPPTVFFERSQLTHHKTDRERHHLLWLAGLDKRYSYSAGISQGYLIPFLLFLNRFQVNSQSSRSSMYLMLSLSSVRKGQSRTTGSSFKTSRSDWQKQHRMICPIFRCRSTIGLSPQLGQYAVLFLIVGSIFFYSMQVDRFILGLGFIG